MTAEYQIGIIIQARPGSSRLPGKMIIPFYQGKSLAELMIEKTRSAAGSLPVCLAASDQKEDDVHPLSPGDGLRVAEKHLVIGKTARVNIPPNEIIYLKMITG